MEELGNCLLEILTRPAHHLFYSRAWQFLYFNKSYIFMWHLVSQINPIFRVFEVDTYNSLRILGLKWIISLPIFLFLFGWNSMMTTIGYSNCWVRCRRVREPEFRRSEAALLHYLPGDILRHPHPLPSSSVNENDSVSFWENIETPIQSNLWDFYISFIHYFRWWRRGLDEDRRHACYKLRRHRLIWVL